MILLLFSLLICQTAAIATHGSSLEFDGSNAYINCGNAASLSVDGTDKVTVFAWVYLPTLGDEQKNIVSCTYGSPKNGYYLQVINNVILGGCYNAGVQAYRYGNTLLQRHSQRYTVSDDAITRIHDLINDPDRECVWGITRSDDAINYIFKIDRIGVITKQALGTTGQSRGMMVIWGGDYLWVPMIYGTASMAGRLAKINPNTMEVTFFDIDETIGVASVAFDGNYIYVGGYQDNAATIWKFNVATETVVSSIAVDDVEHLYWALFDGTYVWFAGETLEETPTAALIKLASDESYTVYDMGASNTGAEICYDGTNIWCGDNEGTNLIKFNISTETESVLTAPCIPRLVEYNPADGFLWIAGSINYSRLNIDTGVFDPIKSLGENSGYEHGLTFNGVDAWIGTWRDAPCYIYRAHPASGDWFHVGVVCDGRYVKVYFNGVLDGLTDWTSYEIGANNVDLLIGYRPTVYFAGSIDEVCIYNRALDISEINWNYNHPGRLYSTDSLVGYWKFNEYTGTVAGDSSGAGNHGTISDATWSIDTPVSSAKCIKE